MNPTPYAGRYDYAYAGVCLLSRYGKTCEFETMMAAIDWIIDRKPETANLIVEIFCDSKADSYVVKCAHPNHACSSSEVYDVAHMFSLALRDVAGGHDNVAADGIDHRWNIGPYWEQDLL